MLDIIGLIKVDETKPERINYLIACIRSYAFLQPYCRFVLTLENPSDELYELVGEELKSCDYDYDLYDIKKVVNYGKIYCKLISEGRNNYIINFMEDQFMLINDKNQLLSVLETMDQYMVEVCKCSFLKIEQNSSRGIKFMGE